MSGYTMTQPELYYSFSAASTQLATFTTEASLMGNYPIPQIPATFFDKLGNLSSSMKVRAIRPGRLNVHAHIHDEHPAAVERHVVVGGRHPARLHGGNFCCVRRDAGGLAARRGCDPAARSPQVRLPARLPPLAR